MGIIRNGLRGYGDRFEVPWRRGEVEKSVAGGAERVDLHLAEARSQRRISPASWRFPSREAEFLAGGFIILGIAFVYPYVEGLVNRFTPGCLFHRVTGLPCLLCGMTRSLAATAHGRLEEAFRLHLLGPPVFFLVVAATAALTAELVSSRRILPRPGRGAVKMAAWGVLGLLIAAWVARMTLFGVNV